MTPDERADVAMRLIAMQGTLRTLMEAASTQAELCHEAGASGLAFSIFMLEEALRGYSKALGRWVADILDENPLDTPS